MAEQQPETESDYVQWYDGNQIGQAINKAVRGIVQSVKLFMKAVRESSDTSLRGKILNKIQEIHSSLKITYSMNGGGAEWKQRKAILMAMDYIEMIQFYLENPELFWHKDRLEQCFNLFVSAKEELDPFAKSLKTTDSTNFFFDLEGDVLEKIVNLIRNEDFIENQYELDNIVEELRVNRQFLIDLQYDLLGGEEEIDITGLVKPIISFQSHIIGSLRRNDIDTVQRLIDQYQITLDEGKTLLVQLKKNPKLKFKFSSPQGRGNALNLDVDQTAMRSHNFKELLTAVGPTDPKPIKDIVRLSGLSMNTVRLRLPELENAGLVKKSKNGRYNFYQRTRLGTTKLKELEEPDDDDSGNVVAL